MKRFRQAAARIRAILLILLLGWAVLFLCYQISCCRVTATAKGNKLYYGSSVYYEVIDSRLDIDTGRCLGTVQSELGETCRFYECKGLPNYLYVSLGWDYFLYRLYES